MPPECAQELEKVGRKVVRWRAQHKAVWFVAALLLAAAVFGALDFSLQLGRTGRLATAAALLALAGTGAALMGRALRVRISPQGAAAMVERTFPELDNRLINYLQFATAAGDDAFASAYVQQGAPSWQSLELRNLRDGRAHRRGLAALAVATALLAAPMLFLGMAWPVAVWRAVNPFAQTPPLTLTRIVKIEPGDTTSLQGQPLMLTCTVRGFTGHEVRVDLHPDDAEKATISLGRIEGAGEQVFSRRIPSVTTGLRYRFRAGDAPASPWYTVGLRSPPALTSVGLQITPPEHTRRPAASWTPAQGELQVLQGSTVEVRAVANTKLASMTLTVPGQAAAPMTASADGKEWTVRAVLAEGRAMSLKAEDPHGDGFAEELDYRLVPDQNPSLEVLAPTGRAVLPAGEFPRIEFSAQDDFGLSKVWLERVEPGAADDAAGTVVKEWTPAAAPGLREMWRGDTALREGEEAVFRLRASDNRPGEPGAARSGLITFQTPSREEAEAQREKLEQQAAAGLKKVVELQRQALGETRHHRGEPESGTREMWAATALVQKQVRELTRELLANPIRPLGWMSDTVNKLYLEEMTQAPVLLKEIPEAPAEARGARIDGLVKMQEKILRSLTAAGEAAGSAQAERRVTGLTSALQNLIRDQAAVLKGTKAVEAAKAAPGAKLVDEQDRLASAVSAFRASCAEESAAVKVTDPAFSAVLAETAAKCDQLKIREDMTLAAERLEGKAPAEAVPLQEKALASLKSLDGALGEVRMQEEEQKKAEMVEAAAQAKEKLGKIKDLHARMLAAMDAVRGQKDKDTAEADQLQTAFEEMIKDTKEPLLEVPNDLHVFMDLNVANELVEDVFSVYEEVEQVAGTENKTAKDFIEKAYAKEEVVLEMMEKMEGRIDDMEKWLDDEPDPEKVTTEAFDKEEMPEAGMALGALASKVEDLISDLLEEPKELDDASADAATNHGLPDMEGIGWKVEEGNIATFAGKGVSGSQTPDHKEQDGRSNVGRQGMSSGETSAGSGTINKGDDNIEARRTEDPVQSGQVDLAGEAVTRATGGGKLGTGKADGKGMGGGAKRLDSTEEGSSEGMAALMARQADAVYAQASLKNMRVDSLKDAAHHIRQSGDAIARGEIGQSKEFRQLAVGALRKAQAELSEGPTGVVEFGRAPDMLKDAVEGGPDMAPPQFRDSVSEYYKALNESL